MAEKPLLELPAGAQAMGEARARPYGLHSYVAERRLWYGRVRLGVCERRMYRTRVCHWAVPAGGSWYPLALPGSGASRACGAVMLLCIVPQIRCLLKVQQYMTPWVCALSEKRV